MDTSLREVGLPTLRAARTPNHEAYRRIRRNVTELLADERADPDAVVPACPEWTLRGLVGHLVGVASVAIGRLSGWPAAHAGSSADMSTADLLATWRLLGSEVDLLLADRGGAAGTILVMDAFVHELDIRYALGAEPVGRHPAFAGAFAVLANGFAASVTAHQLPALRLSTGRTQWTVGDGEPVATLTADPYDLVRSLAGRRTPEQIAALAWDRDSHRWLPAFTWGPFTPPGSPVEPAAG